MSWFSRGLASHGVRLTEASFLGPDPDWAGDNLNPSHAYRSLTSQGTRSLEALDQDRMFEIAVFMAAQNPIGRRIIEFLVDYTVGEGITYKAGDAALTEVLDEFWHDPVNAWPLKQFRRIGQLFIFGEQIYPAFVNRDGRVRLGYIDPANVKTVLTDPNNAEVVTTVTLKSRQGVEPPPLPVIRMDEREDSPTKGLLMGPGTGEPSGPQGTFFFAINNLTNAARGRSDLLCGFDWLDLYDKFLFSQAERASYYTDLLWDVTLDDMDEDQIKAWLAKNPIPRGSSLRAHNQKIHWQAIAPDLHAQDVSEHARTMRMQIAIPHAIPEGHLFAGGETNRSTLENQSEPMLKYLSRRQKGVKGLVQFILEFVRDQAIRAGRLRRDMDDEARKITVEASEVSTRDLSKMAVTLKDTTSAAMVGEQQRYLTKAEAAQLVRRVASEFGVELSPLPEGMGAEAETVEPPEETLPEAPTPLELARASELAQRVRQARPVANQARR